MHSSPAGFSQNPAFILPDPFKAPLAHTVVMIVCTLASKPEEVIGCKADKALLMTHQDHELQYTLQHGSAFNPVAAIGRRELLVCSILMHRTITQSALYCVAGTLSMHWQHHAK